MNKQDVETILLGVLTGSCVFWLVRTTDSYAILAIGGALLGVMLSVLWHRVGENK